MACIREQLLEPGYTRPPILEYAGLVPILNEPSLQSLTYRSAAAESRPVHPFAGRRQTGIS
jgi:hypothetical protein